jgi:hypothetical protein
LPAKGEETILTHASTRGNSLRTTVPVDVARQLGLKEGETPLGNPSGQQQSNNTCEARKGGEKMTTMIKLLEIG